MEKLKVICYINSAGANFMAQNITETILSIHKNINTNYKFFITTDNQERKSIIENIINQNFLKDYLIDIKVSNESWAKCFNSFFESYENLTEYILCSHDDLIVRTYDFFNITKEQISGFEDTIGWIGFTSDSYYRLNGNSVCQSAREIFCLDRHNWPKTFELHKMGNSYREDLLDMPKRACKIPGIFSHFNLIKSENLRKIGLCPEWGKYTLLIDEHWSLKTLVSNMWTIWVPQVFYDHPLRYNERPVQGIQDGSSVESSFFNEWGYNYTSKLEDSIIESVCNRFKNTNINFFNNKNTFDYQYLK